MGALSLAFRRGPIGKRERYAQLRSSLWSDRSSFDAHWREIADFILPTRTRFTASQRNQGGKRNQNIIDSTGRFALRTLASGLHAGLTSPARPWFKLTTPDPSLAEFKPVKDWLHIATERMQTVIGSSNVYQAFSKVYSDMGGFGTAAMSILPDRRDLFRARHYPLGSYAIGTDSRGMANIFVRDYEMTVLQLVEEFGVQDGYNDIDWTRLSRTVHDLWDRGSYTATVEVCWIVQPNIDYNPDRLESKYLPFSSCHFEKGEERAYDVFLRESGFYNFPVLVPRWEVSDDGVYGEDCPGMTALGDIKQLQGMAREKAKAIKKMVDPPMVGSPELRTQKTSTIAGDITYVRDTQHGFKAAHEIGLNLEHLLYDIRDVRQMIRQAFYADLFLMMATSDQMNDSGQPITAREVAERHEEKLLALGPMLETTEDEMLDPFIDNTFDRMERAGMFPDPPPELEGVVLDVKYTSIMAEAQKMVSVTGLDRFVASVFPIVQADPSLRHKIDGYQIIDNYQDALGADPRIIRATDEAKQLAEQEAQAARGMQDAAAAAQLASAAKDASQAKMGTDSALDRMVSGAAGMAQ